MRSLSESYQSYFFRYVSRQGNKVAHLLATEGMRSIDLSDTRGASIRCCDGKGLVVNGSTRLGVPFVDFLQAIFGICSSSRDNGDSMSLSFCFSDGLNE
ncbi:hypothetical protein Gorai_014651, partial [Gossypium raimondii]|nr:hypothetical protein [Gossypium raimondii]